MSFGVSGKYRLDRRLGGGGMAEVFVGSTVGAEGFTRKIAIKRVLPGYSDNPAFAQMFVAEAQISSRMVHPNIVSVLDFDRDAENRLFLVMELVEGKDLDTLMASGLLPFPVVIYVIGEVLRGLGYAHDLPAGTQVRGIVHRDVSPHNVLLSWEGAVKVSDFGIAKARAASEATASVFIKGKPAYMSPEQANGQPLDGRSDLFAVGVMLWEMLVGRQLFVGEDTRSTLALVLFGQVPRPRSLRPEIPKDLEKVCMKLLERDLPARYATAEQAIADLVRCADAPRDGREVLTAILGERFPSHAPLRHSAVRARSRNPAAPPATTLIDGSAVPPTDQSLGAAMSAPTSALPPRRGVRIVIIAVGLVTFGMVAALGSKESRPDAANGSQSAPALVHHDDAAIDARPDAPIDAPIDSPGPVDAGIPDASKPPSAHAEKYGTLEVYAFPVLTVTVDNHTYGETSQRVKLTVGQHKLRLTNTDRGYDETITVTITADHTTTIKRMQ